MAFRWVKHIAGALGGINDLKPSRTDQPVKYAGIALTLTAILLSRISPPFTLNKCGRNNLDNPIADLILLDDSRGGIRAGIREIGPCLP